MIIQGIVNVTFICLVIERSVYKRWFYAIYEKYKIL